ncbi:hypothetical protein [Streptomyces sp. AVP053U2]|uniref:hypothetical protein n=1 Tax=Streptomyces sp. AVP053U2 TaxID=1737066 RepID=UPI00073BB352|nr:hypothetical protein [Streptomyces sp. AVP053U2]ODA69537.1 hypothetical protein APS67_006341 [Streptomyces sp. AVP053U2]
MTQQHLSAPLRAQITHANGLTFTIVSADSYTARIARDVRQLAMDDGTVWTVGTRGAGNTIAWQPAEQTHDAGSDDACPLCGRWNCNPTTCPPSAADRAHAAEAVAGR